MKGIVIVLLLIFSAVLCAIEVPPMWRSKEYKELAAFSVILCFGMVIVVLKSCDVGSPNPGDFIKFIYSPIVNLMKGALE